MMSLYCFELLHKVMFISRKNKYSSTTVRVREVRGSNPRTPTGKNGTSPQEEVSFFMQYRNFLDVSEK